MRIDIALWAPEIVAPPAARSGSQIGSKPATNEARSGDPANPSLDLERIHALVDQVSEFPEVRQIKVGVLARAFRLGVYRVKPDETAEALLSQMEVRPAA
jgi:hypothetical protein